ncbi:MAG: hypothetical protein U9P00_06115 [Pseudomonadota bacterium]|nr:hypothetical protein [Pseudomonadota bacterium]
MFYVTLGNLGFCPPDGGDGNSGTCDNGGPPGWGLTNTAEFSNVQSLFYWSGSALDSSGAWGFSFDDGGQINDDESTHLFAWAVRSGG